MEGYRAVVGLGLRCGDLFEWSEWGPFALYGSSCGGRGGNALDGGDEIASAMVKVSKFVPLPPLRQMSGDFLMSVVRLNRLTRCSGGAECKVVPSGTPNTQRQVQRRSLVVDFCYYFAVSAAELRCDDGYKIVYLAACISKCGC